MSDALDTGFRIYRRHHNKIIPVIMPDDEQTPGSRLAESPVAYRVRRRPAKGS